jgi:hypothetical protein
MPSNNTKVTAEQREFILATFLRGDSAEAAAHARSLGLKYDYPYKLARERGLLPREGKRWGILREVA